MTEEKKKATGASGVSPSKLQVYPATGVGLDGKFIGTPRQFPEMNLQYYDIDENFIGDVSSIVAVQKKRKQN